MIMFTFLMIALLILAIIATIFFGIVGTVIAVVLGDVIICAYIIYKIIRRSFKKRKGL